LSPQKKKRAVSHGKGGGSWGGARRICKSSAKEKVAEEKRREENWGWRYLQSGHYFEERRGPRKWSGHSALEKTEKGRGALNSAF